VAVLEPLAWVGLGVVALAALYLSVRLASRAYYKSRAEYDARRKEHEPDTENPGG